MNFAKVTRGPTCTFWVNLDLVTEIRSNTPSGNVLYFGFLRPDGDQAFAIVDQSPEELLGIGKNTP